MAYFRTGANDYSSLQYNNLTAGNVKKDVTVTVKDANNQTLKSVTGAYTTNTFTNLTAGNIKNGVTVTIKDTDNTTLKSVTGTCTPLPTNSVALVNTQNTVGGSYTTTRHYDFIVCAGSGSSNDNNTGLMPSFSCNGGTTMINANRDGGYDNSISFGRLTVFKDVPAGKTITYSPGSNNSNTYIIYGIY